MQYIVKSFSWTVFKMRNYCIATNAESFLFRLWHFPEWNKLSKKRTHLWHSPRCCRKEGAIEAWFSKWFQIENSVLSPFLWQYGLQCDFMEFMDWHLQWENGNSATVGQILMISSADPHEILILIKWWKNQLSSTSVSACAQNSHYACSGFWPILA